MSLCKGGSCSSAIVKCPIHGEVGDKSGDEGGCGARLGGAGLGGSSARLG